MLLASLSIDSMSSFIFQPFLSLAVVAKSFASSCRVGATAVATSFILGGGSAASLCLLLSEFHSLFEKSTAQRIEDHVASWRLGCYVRALMV